MAIAAMGTEQLDSMLRRDETFLREIWAWFAVGTVVILLRFAVRIRMVGPKGLKGDDYVMILVSTRIIRVIAESTF